MGSWLAAIPQKIIDRNGGVTDKNTIEYWQQHVFYVISLTGLLAGTLCIAPAAGLLLAKGSPVAGALLLAIYLLNLLSILSRSLAVKTKALIIVFSFYLLAVVSIVNAGPVAESGIWFSMSVIECSLFVGMRSSIAFAFLDLATGVFVGFLHKEGLIEWNVLQHYHLGAWIVQRLAVLFVGLIFVMANSVLVRGVGSSFRDLNAAENRVRASLREKETLIRELYHRSKNNMQVISSLLSLHQRDLKDDAAKEVFRDVINKINAMAMVHQRLYESQDLSNVDMAEYLRDLVALLKKSYAVSSDRVRVDLDLETLPLLIDTAVPCALVASEIITNSLKHAFPDDRSGILRIKLEGLDDEQVQLTISDDGVGLPEGFQMERDGHMGIKTLLMIVSHQLRGTIEIDRSKGVAYRVRFTRGLYEKRVAANG